jgi:ABC-type multidrug transport system fused ATPase/permease subunit
VTSTPPSESLTQTLRTVLALLTRTERRRLGWVLVASLGTAGFETAGVASILPFMALVVDPGVLTRYPVVARVAEFLGADTWREAVLWAAAGTGLMVAVGNAARIGGSWLHWRFESDVRHRLASDLQRAFMYAPYSFHVKRDAASLLKVISHDVRSVTTNLLIPMLSATSRGFLVLALLGLLAVQSPLVAAGAFLTLGGAYSLVFRLTKRRQSDLGQQANKAEYEWRLTSQEGLAGIKELTVLERRDTTAARFADADRQLADISVSRRVTEIVPRHLLETLTLLCILVVTVVLLGSQEAGAASAIPTLTLYVFVGYRLMPGLQQLYGSAMSVRFGMPALTAFLADWQETAAGVQPQTTSEVARVTFADRISIRDVTFRYPKAVRPALADITLDIRRGESIGFIGRTGAGKSTLADILLGLIEPGSGSITIDGVPLTLATVAGWRHQIGYVAQHIFLSNASIAENIALGFRREEIDQAAVQEAAKLAQIDEFVATLPKGYDTKVGERGVRFSGGERQRVGIARALYARPSVLVFDEATSALDGLTEEAVMDAIRRLSGERTVILIAHRLRTLDACDRLVLLDAGRIVAIGSPAELEETSEEFRRFRGRS